MAQVTLRDKISGVRTKFFLKSGRVVVDRVLQALEATVVKLDDGDGTFSVLEPDVDGTSLNIFTPGQLVDVLIVPRQQQQVGLDLGAGPSFSSGGNALSSFLLDVDWPTTYLDCELVHEIDLGVHICTKVYTWNEFKSGKVTTRQDPQTQLVKYPPPSFVGSYHDEDWDELHTVSQRKQHFKCIDSWLQLPKDTGFQWLTNATKAGLKKVFDNRVTIGTKNNEVLADPSLGLRAAVLGVNIYKRLTWPAILRTHLEYLLWAVTSQLPYMQLLTDMSTGGLFYACNGERDANSVVWIVVMQDMEQVKEAFQHLGKNLPRSVDAFSQQERIEFRTLPRRVKFPHPGAKYPPAMDWAPEMDWTHGCSD